MDCPHCDKEVVDVKGPYDSKKDGVSQFKMVVHERKNMGVYNAIPESCYVHIE
jgi:hypothetical protein